MRDPGVETAPVWPLEHEIQAQALADLLAQRHIPFILERFEERAWDGVFLPQRGFGRIRVYEEDHERAEGLIRNFLAQLQRDRRKSG